MVKGPSDHETLASEKFLAVLDPGGDTSCEQAFDNAAVMRFIKESNNALRAARTDLVNRKKTIEVRFH